MWPKLKLWFDHSLTIAWSYALAASALVAEGLSDLPEVLQSAGLEQYIPPQWLGRYTLALAALTWLARMRGIWATKKDA